MILFLSPVKVATEVAIYRMGNGPGAKIPEKWERKWKTAPGPKWPKNGNQNGKMDPKMDFGLIWPSCPCRWPFFGHFRPGAIFHFLSHFFRDFCFRPVSHSVNGRFNRKVKGCGNGTSWRFSCSFAENAAKTWVPKESMEITVHANVRVARLQKEVGTKDPFRVTDFLTKNAPNFIFPESLGPFILWVRKRNAKFPPNPRNTSLPKIIKIHRRTSAGAQGEPNGMIDRETSYVELFLRFIEDTDADDNDFRIFFS